MKYKVIIIALLTALFTVSTVKAGNGDTTKKGSPEAQMFSADGVQALVKMKNNNAIELIFNKADKEKLKVFIYSDGVLLFKDWYRNTQNGKITYDISSFPTGNYTIKLVKGNAEFIRGFTKVSAQN